MLKENWRFIGRIERAGDLVLIIFSFFAAYYGRESLAFWDTLFGLGLPLQGDELAPLKDYAFVLLISVIGYMSSLHFLGGYSSMRLSSKFRLLRLSFMSSVFVFLLLSSSLFLLKLDLSRGFLVLFCALVTLLLTAQRYLVLTFLRYWRRRGKNFRNVLICGSGHQALMLAARIASRPELGIRVRGYVDLAIRLTPGSAPLLKFRKGLVAAGYRRSGRIIRGIESFDRALKEYAIDEVMFTDIAQDMSLVEEGIEICAQQGVETTVAADLFGTGLMQSRVSNFEGMPLIHFQTPPGDSWKLGVKRGVDVAASAVALVLLSPFLLVIALLVKSDSKGPVLFRQRRVGRNGRLFWMYKFRSMVTDAEARLEQLLGENEMVGPVFKLKKDPRVTRFGRFMRKYSIDELPQLFNVFRGDMSLVGPRPPVPGEVSMYNRRDRRRLSMRPGMTCIWQVSGRNKIKDFDEWVQMDLEYIDNWSLSRDFVLIAQTIPAVFSGEGAH